MARLCAASPETGAKSVMVTAMLDMLAKLLMAVLLLAWAVRRARNNRRLRVHEQGGRYEIGW